jgi:polysaccharide biosynthesis transport protein
MKGCNQMNPSVTPLTVIEDHASSAAEDKEQSQGLSLVDIARSLVKNKWLILACTLISVFGAAVYVVTAKPVFEASASIRIDPSRAGSLGLNDLLSVMGGDSSGEQIQTEMSILQSDQVALATLDNLTPEQFRAYAGFDKGAMNFASSNHQLSRAQENLLGGFKGALITKQIEGTQLVGIRFRNTNPEIASAVVNNIIAAYIRGNFDSRYESVNQVRAWLSSQMDDLRERASTAQKKLAVFQEQNNLIGTDPSNNTIIDRIKLLNERLTMAEGDRIVKEAQVRAAATGDPAILATLLPDAKLQSLQGEEGTLYAQYIEESTKFGTAYPPLMEVKVQLANVRSQIAQSVHLISARLGEDYDASHRAENMLRDQYQAETGKAYALNRVQADYAVLLAEATSSRDLFDTLQYKLQQASVDAGLNSVNTMIVDRARAPIDPVWPKKLLTLVGSLVLGAVVGVGAALLRESLSDQVQSLEQIELATGLISLANVPHLPMLPPTLTAQDQSGRTPEIRNLIAISEPRSRGAESYRALRNSILLSSIDRPARSILITSSLPGEGKSATAANYAVILAQKGGRVLLVDADLRRPTLHRYFGVANTAGVSDAIIGEVSEAVVGIPIPALPELHFLPAGGKVSLPSEALGSMKFHAMLKEWEQQYDTVIFDSAPVLSVSDTVPLASWADAVVLVVRAGVTPLSALQRTKTILRRAHVRIAGVVLNDISNQIGDYGYYAKYDDGYYN